ncbi:MAG: nuclear transport factor 2 family protein [Flavobacteriales bacterium]|nr:nuclear transport factor 2 family protein [Flavobacteriales bacterium]
MYIVSRLRLVLFVGLLTALPAFGFGQRSVIEQVLNEQVEAFNQHDVARMAQNVSDDFVWYSVMSDSVTIESSGRAAFTKAMTGYFSHYENVKSTIQSTTISGNKISFEENVSWPEEDVIQEQSALGVYEIKNGKITRAWYFY